MLEVLAPTAALALPSTPGNRSSTSASADTSPESCWTTAALIGASDASAGWGCEPRHAVLPACCRQAGPASPRQGWRVPRPRFAAYGPDGLPSARRRIGNRSKLAVSAPPVVLSMPPRAVKRNLNEAQTTRPCDRPHAGPRPVAPMMDWAAHPR